MNFRVRLLWIFLGLGMVACNPGSKIQGNKLKDIPEALLGSFKDDYGSSYTITGKQWTQDKKITYHLLLYNKQENYFIARNDSGNPGDSSLFTRIDIIFFEKMEPWRWGYCLTAFKAPTMQDAIKTPSADKTNPRMGCNGFPFSRMKKSG